MAAGRHGRRSAGLAVLCALLFLTFLDNTIVSVALGSVQATLQAGVSALQWVVGAYALTFAGAMLACGMIGDEFGRKRVMLAGAGVFCAGSALCALAPATGLLITGRAVMGLGAAASEPGTLSMLRHLYPQVHSRSRAIGVWAAVSGLALAAGPVLGGALVGVWGWRAIFWFNLAFGLAALAAAALILPESADPDAHRVDTAGALLGAAALTALVFAVIEGESAGYGTPWVGALFGVSLLAAAAFGWHERRAPHPLLDLGFLRVPQFVTANVVAFCSYFATFAIFFFTALYLEEVAGYSGYRIALAFAPMATLMILASLLAGRRAGMAAQRWLMAGGCLAFGAGLLLTNAFLSPQPPYVPLVAALALAGAGIGTTVVPVTSAALDAAPPQRSGMAASAANTSREVGAVTGVAVLGALVNTELRATLTSKLTHLGIPANFQALVIHALETGRVPPSGKPAGAPPGEGSLVRQVIQAAYAAFQAGLHVALYLSAGLVLGAGLLAALMLAPRNTAARPGRARTSQAPPSDDHGHGERAPPGARQNRPLQGETRLFPRPGSARRTWR